MKKLLPVALLTALFSIAVYPAFAQDAISPALPNTSSPTTANQRVQDQKNRIQEKLDTRKANIQQRINDNRERVASRVGQQRERLEANVARLQDRQANFAQRLEDKRSRIATRSAALKQRIQAFKDKKKADLTQKVNDNLNRINDNRTTEMLRHIDRLSEILNKATARADQAAVSLAQNALESAKTTAQAQQSKDYTLQVTSESTIRATAKTARDSLHADLKATHQEIVKAKDLVIAALKTIAQPQGGADGQ